MAGTSIGRLGRLAGLAARFGRIGVIVSAHAVVLAPGVVGGWLRRRPTARTGDQLVRLLTALGPSYIKIGQLLSTRRDLLPEQICVSLGRLTDSTPPPRRARIEKALRHAYRGREWPFAEFDWTAVASGSIATVHRAVTVDGRAVAVKVRRPGIDGVMRRDFRLMGVMMRMLGLLPPLRSMPFDVMLDQVGGAVLRQLDFAAERDSLVALRANLASLPWARVPEPLPDLCGDGVLVMEYVDGLLRFAPEELDAAARGRAARRALAAVYEMLFVDGLVHCDLHPGNMYVDRDGSLVILDAGFVITLPKAVRDSFADFFINMSMGNGPFCAEIVIDSAASVAPDCDLDGFRAGLTELVDGSVGARSGEFNLARFAGRLFDLQRRFGLYPAPEFAFPLLSLLVMEGMVQGFDPDLDFQAEAIPVLRRRNTPRAAAL
ncbi:ABC1 kinase family protein [Streptomyces sp. NPDC092296]|uniref:ABC1 kinase family protein n=1 Tax=Streptomyces sp. NPDC092296 TaxID=3366012 RepID=UPI00381AB961